MTHAPIAITIDCAQPLLPHLHTLVRSMLSEADGIEVVLRHGEPQVRVVNEVVQSPEGRPDVRQVLLNGGARETFSLRSGLDQTVSIVVPALNEAENLCHVLPRIPTWVHEVILIDGRSIDHTADVARELRPGIRIVEQRSRGKGGALREGFESASGDIIVTIDADGSTDPGEIPFFVGALLAGADYAKGTRFAQGGGSSDISLLRRLGNLVLTIMFRLLFRNRCTDLCYGYNAFRASALPILRPDSDGFEIETLMSARAMRAGLKVVEVPSHEASRVHGQSNLKAFEDGWRILRTLMRESFTKQQQPAGGEPMARPRQLA